MANKKFYIHETADNDLRNIFVYRVENFGIERADQYINDLVITFQTLANNYKQGRNCGHIHPDLYAQNVISHIIFYKPTNDGVSIYRILHKSMDYQNHLEFNDNQTS